MKVLMTADAVGGVWTYVFELCRALGDADLEFVIATTGPAPTSTQRERMQALPNIRLLHREGQLEWMASPWRDVERAGEWLLDVARSEHVDLVHLNGYAHAALPWDCPVIVVAHSCVCSWWQAVHGVSAPIEWDRYRRVVAAGIAVADVVVAPTQTFLDEITALYGSPQRCVCIHNGLAQPQGESIEQREALIFACGRAWDGAKNLSLLDSIAAQIPWPTFIAGECASPDGRTRGFGSAQCLGALAPEDVHAWMNRAAVFAHPALYEPFGLAVLEAAQRGCALVLSDIPTLRELWSDSAVYADPRDPQAWRSTVLALIANHDQQKKFARAARIRAQLFTRDAMGSAYLALYRELASKRSHTELAVA